MSSMVAFFATFPGAKTLSFNNLPPNFSRLRSDVGFYTNRGGTIGWLLNSDGCVVVDSQFPDSANDCLNGIKSMLASDFDLSDADSYKIDALINTHHHGDHTGGNESFRNYVKSIVAHENVPGLQEMQASMRGGSSEIVSADTTFTNSWSLDVGSETVRAFHYGPAHTKGDSVIHFEEANVVHMGDLVFNRVFPFIDEAGGASISNWILLLEQVGNQFDSETKYIFGHGQQSYGINGTRADVLKMRDYLSALLEHVHRSLQLGWSRDETSGILSLNGFEDYVSFGPRLSLSANIDVAWNEVVRE